MNQLNIDFDNDKIKDIITIVQNKTEFYGYLLLIYVSSENKTYSFRLVTEDGIKVLPVQLRHKNKVIEVGYFNDGTGAFGHFLKLKYNSKISKIQLVGYDTSYRFLAGRCNKSYNLLNGNFKVIIDNEDLSTGKTKRKYFKGKKDPENIFLYEIDETILNKLDKVGEEFEPK